LIFENYVNYHLNGKDFFEQTTVIFGLPMVTGPNGSLGQNFDTSSQNLCRNEAVEYFYFSRETSFKSMEVSNR
jgi:hypothetical protein